MTREMLKTAAKQQLRGKWIVSVLAVLCVTLIYGVISGAASVLNVFADPAYGSVGSVVVLSIVVFILEIIAVILLSGMMLGIMQMFLKIARGEAVAVKDIFCRMQYSLKAFGLVIVVGIFVCLWSILFIIPGIIAAYRYSQVFFIMAENPEIGIMEAIRRSKEMMTGHKMEFFVLQLSFIGWAILAAITVIGTLWYEVYADTTYANYYLGLMNGQSAAAEDQI